MHGITRLELNELIDKYASLLRYKCKPTDYGIWWNMFCNKKLMEIDRALEKYCKKHSSFPKPNAILAILEAPGSEKPRAPTLAAIEEKKRLESDYTRLLAEMAKDGTLRERYDELCALRAKLAAMERGAPNEEKMQLLAAQKEDNGSIAGRGINLINALAKRWGIRRFMHRFIPNSNE